MASSQEHVLTLAREALNKGIADLGIALDTGRQDLMLQYLLLLEKWNQVYNLTAIRDVSKMVSAHLLDSLSVVPFLSSGRILDVGTGAGLPGIPIAIACPESEITLLDSSHKKTAFLRQAVADLSLVNAQVVCERVESWNAPAAFDVVISRAFSDLGEFVSVSGRLLAPGGMVAAMKGLHPFEELERMPPGFRVRTVEALRVPGLDVERHLVLIERA